MQRIVQSIPYRHDRVTISDVPELRLTTTSYVVLGMIALHGHCTPYRLKRAVGESVGLFWHFPHAQLYAEPDRLADLGLLARSVENGGTASQDLLAHRALAWTPCANGSPRPRPSTSSCATSPS